VADPPLRIFQMIIFIIVFILSCIIATCSKTPVKWALIGTAVFTFFHMPTAGSAERAGTMLVIAPGVSLFIIWLPVGLVEWRRGRKKAKKATQAEIDKDLPPFTFFPKD
jgi:hypothetical protein